MKVFLILSLMSLSLSTHAISTKRLVKVCEKAGIEKLILTAKVENLKIDQKTVKVCGVDNRTLNVSSYVWYCAMTTGGEKELIVMTQKPMLQPCF